MNITSEEVIAFQEAYAIDYGEEITEDEAREMLACLVCFDERLAEPLPVKPPTSYSVYRGRSRCASIVPFTHLAQVLEFCSEERRLDRIIQNVPDFVDDGPHSIRDLISKNVQPGSRHEPVG